MEAGPILANQKDTKLAEPSSDPQIGNSLTKWTFNSCHALIRTRKSFHHATHRKHGLLYFQIVQTKQMVGLEDPLKLPCGAVLQNRLCKAAMTEGLADEYGRATVEHERLYQGESKLVVIYFLKSMDMDSMVAKWLWATAYRQHTN